MLNSCETSMFDCIQRTMENAAFWPSPGHLPWFRATQIVRTSACVFLKAGTCRHVAIANRNHSCCPWHREQCSMVWSQNHMFSYKPTSLILEEFLHYRLLINDGVCLHIKSTCRAYLCCPQAIAPICFSKSPRQRDVMGWTSLTEERHDAYKKVAEMRSADVHSKSLYALAVRL